MVEYRHAFTAALAQGLYLMYRRNRAVNLKVLGLTRNQWDNFQKLRYWGLVEKAERADGKRIGGAWRITQHGIDFIERRVSVQRAVWTYRGERVRFEGDPTTFEAVHGPYMTRPDYSDQSRPHTADLFAPQANLLDEGAHA
jgi:hypothetical protein